MRWEAPATRQEPGRPDAEMDGHTPAKRRAKEGGEEMDTLLEGGKCVCMCNIRRMGGLIVQ